MADIFQRQQWRLRQRWFSPEDARRIAYEQQKNKWNISDWYKLSDQWKQYGDYTSLQREIIRKSQIYWRPAYHYQIIDWKVRLNPLFSKKKK